MAKKKRYYDKKKVLKAIGKYYRTTISKVIQLVGSTNGVALAGDSSGYTLNNLLGTTSTYQELGKQFALFKVRGVYIEVNPWFIGTGGGMLCLALQQTNEENNNGQVYSQPNVIPMSAQQITRKYIKIGSTWMPTNDSTVLSNLKLAYQVVQSFSTSMNFSILIKLYLTFKISI